MPERLFPGIKCVEIDYQNRNFKFYNEKNQFHNETGPAIIHFDNCRIWYLNDKIHRINGPAVIWADGDFEYWIKGNQYNKKGYYLGSKHLKYEI